ncbi:MAG: triose-phosphate isomerase [Bacteroidetes bacterium]|nr:triose-phosphate isomerase [Bacteroidota bacterium]
MRTKIVAGNWKMNTNREEAFSLATEVSGMLKNEQVSAVKVILAPPFVHIGAVAQLLNGTGIGVAAQNCASEVSGAFTGEISAPMIHSVGASYVLIGHSERRAYFNEDNALLAKKTQLALDHHLIPIFCVGETLPERESGKHEETVFSQLEEGLFILPDTLFSKVIIAYEPVWAIGTGKTASPAQAQEMHAFIRGKINNRYGDAIAQAVSILYGGSCNENNATELFALPDVDGGLIGGASLKSRSFVNIIKSFS